MLGQIILHKKRLGAYKHQQAVTETMLTQCNAAAVVHIQEPDMSLFRQHPHTCEMFIILLFAVCI